MENLVECRVRQAVQNLVDFLQFVDIKVVFFNHGGCEGVEIKENGHHIISKLVEFLGGSIDNSSVEVVLGSDSYDSDGHLKRLYFSYRTGHYFNARALLPLVVWWNAIEHGDEENLTVIRFGVKPAISASA
jgi:hypothetical protein